MNVRHLIPTALALAACGGDGRAAPCGLAALAGPSALLNQFSVPERTLGVVPDQLPPRLVARVVAGPALPAIVGRADTAWVIGVEGAVPATPRPGFGVLVVDGSGTARGVMLYEGQVIEAAPQLGTVSIADTTIPLIGVEAEPAAFEDANCPAFPDSVLR